jgi:hypothetical protein
MPERSTLRKFDSRSSRTERSPSGTDSASFLARFSIDLSLIRDCYLSRFKNTSNKRMRSVQKTDALTILVQGPSFAALLWHKVRIEKFVNH